MDSSELFEPLVLLTSRTISPEDLERLSSIISDEDFNWEIFLAVCFRQKVAGLVFANIRNLQLEDLVAHRAYDVLRHFYFGNGARNAVILEWARHIYRACSDRGLDVRPLKGAVLIPHCYREPGVRCLNDADFFIARSDAGKVSEVMERLGFVQGHFSRARKKISLLSKKEALLWKLKMFNLPPFRMMVESDHIDSVNVDFTFGLSYLENESVDTIVLKESSILGGFRTLEETDFFIHVCCHLHKEASNEAWSALSQDINLIKFCNVTRFFHANIAGRKEKEVIRRANELGVRIPVYFATKYCSEIYSDDDLRKVSDQLRPDDASAADLIYRQGTEPVSVRQSPVVARITTLC